MRFQFNRRAFTFIEILIVISIIAILASTIIPNFIGFDAEARVTATRSSLDSLRTSVNLFRAKEGRYPGNLEELTTTEYVDLNVRRKYLNKIPPEMISDSKGNNRAVSLTADQGLTGTGGWVYVIDTAEVKVNVEGELGSKWGQYENSDPSEW